MSKDKNTESNVKNILSKMKNGEYSPIYFLTGEEPFFIDIISNYIEKNALSEMEKAFNQLVMYGIDTTIDEIVNYAREFPMGSERKVIIVKEAQNIDKFTKRLDKLVAYAKNPMPSTILVICLKYNKLDGRSELAKIIKNHFVYLESTPLRDYEVEKWIPSHLKEFNYTITPIANQLLVSYLGNDLSRIDTELNKLKIVVPEHSEITPEIIEKNIGISKDFNIFELQNALGRKDAVKVMQIIRYFSQNPKDNPMPVITANLYTYFQKLLTYHGTDDKTDTNLAKVLGVLPFFVKDYRDAIGNYPMKKVSQIIAEIRKTDVQSKGVDATSISYSDLLKELITKILN